MFPPGGGINVCLHVVIYANNYFSNNLACFMRLSGDCSLSMFKFRTFIVQYNDSANHLIHIASQMCYDCLLFREMKFFSPRYPSQAFKKETPVI